MTLHIQVELPGCHPLTTAAAQSCRTEPGLWVNVTVAWVALGRCELKQLDSLLADLQVQRPRGLTTALRNLKYFADSS